MAIKLAEVSNAHFTHYESPLGLLKIAATHEHITEVVFVDEKEVLQEKADNALLQQCVHELSEYFTGSRLSFTVPVYQKGTDFQKKVWNELLNIHFGKTISYLTLAKRLGNPDCIRAAASTNGKNQISIIVPCHRVIGSNQSLVGYAGGLPRKRWLLEHENKVANGTQTFF
jgi:methylated-DNA-[protein]-cysteine S-methyltransferase